MTQAEAKSDKTADLFAVRSLLFLPASNPRAIAKAREAGADLVVLDLEDAVKPEDKKSARAAAVAAVATAWIMPVAIRVNGIGTEWHSLDLDAVAGSKADFAVVPRATSAHLIHDIAATISKPVLAMIETAAGVLAGAEIARETAGLIAGTNDLSAGLGISASAGRGGLVYALQRVVLAARAVIFVPLIQRADVLTDDVVNARAALRRAQERGMAPPPAGWIGKAGPRRICVSYSF